jgi:O-antigen/teichoic acid export membrane protein
MDRRIRRDVVWNSFPVLLLGVVGFGLNFLVARWWGAAALGVFNQVTTAMFAFAVVGAGGLQFSVLRALAAATDDEARAAIAVGALVPAVVLAAIATAAFVLVRGPLSHLLDSADVARGVLWAAPGLFCFAINKVLFGIVNGLGRMRAFAVYTSLRYVFIAVALGAIRAADLRVEQLPILWSIAEGILLVILAIELVCTVRVFAPNRWVTWARDHISFGARGVTATLATELNNKLDVWMVGVAFSDRVVGIYSIASLLFEGLLQLVGAVQNIVNPMLARAVASRDDVELAKVVRVTRRWFVPAIVGICAVAAAAFPFVVPWLLGDPAFRQAAWPFAILMLGVAVASPYLAFGHVLIMASLPGWHTVLNVVVISINLALNLALIPAIGVAGAATSTAVTLVISMLILRFLARSQARVSL